MDPFSVLGLPPTQRKLKDVKAAYHRLALKYHPDKAGPAGLEQMKSINVAYRTVIDKKLYDSDKEAPAPGRLTKPVSGAHRWSASDEFVRASRPQPRKRTGMFGESTTNFQPEYKPPHESRAPPFATQPTESFPRYSEDPDSIQPFPIDEEWSETTLSGASSISPNKTRDLLLKLKQDLIRDWRDDLEQRSLLERYNQKIRVVEKFAWLKYQATMEEVRRKW